MPWATCISTPHDLAITSRILELHRREGLDVIHAHYALPHAVSALLARQAASLNDDREPPRVVTTLHGTDITLVGNDESYAPLTQYALRASDAVTTVSRDLRRRTLENFPCGIPEEAIEVIPNFVDVDLFHPDAAPRPEGAPPTAVHVSNFRAVKQVPWIVRAFAEAVGERDAKLVLVGDGPDQDECRRLARELGLGERVQFLGTRDALPELLAPADVFLLASREESFGLSALEAMSCGTPVLATDVGGVSEVVDDGRTGRLVASGDADGYAAAMAELLFDREAATALGLRARSAAVERFERRRVVARYEALYARLCGRS